ncbi:MAG: hypothetical protein JSS27_06765 [Planctomycetes bacterium]|nr:hypothetical protein [Planctomycetota bacterium]
MSESGEPQSIAPQETSAEAEGSCGSRCWASVLLIGRAARLGLRSRLFMPAAAGVFLTFLGWWCIAWMFSGTDDPYLKAALQPYAHCPLSSGCMVQEPIDTRTMNQVLADQFQRELARDMQSNGAFTPSMRLTTITNAPNVWATLSRPVRDAFSLQAGFQTLAFSILALAWASAVWALVGGAICRMAALELAREEKISWGQAMGHALGRWRSLFAAPLFPLVGVLLFALPMAVVGLLGRTNIGGLLLAIVWPVYLLAGFLLAIFVIGLWFGWPLMIAAISTESSDSFDGLSRSFSYVFQRSVTLLGYVAVAVVFNLLAGIAALFFSEMVIYLSTWAASWGTGGGPSELTPVGEWGKRITWFWNSLVRLLATGAVYATFWTSATAIYFLLRRDVDGTELDDVYTDEGPNAYGLPPLRKNDKGQVEVAEPTDAGPGAVADG